jgi:predicted TPR repeat methyltransferase
VHNVAHHKADREIVQEQAPKFVSSIRDWFANALQAGKDLSGNNQALALQFIAKGQFREAIFRLNMALKFKPNDPELWYLMGRCYILLGQDSDAIEPLKKAIGLKSSHEEARFLLASCDPSTPENLMPHTYPVELVKEYFGGIASEYDMVHIDAMGYRGHIMVAELVKQYLPAPDVNMIVADIGCGTGIMGAFLKQYATELRGIDLCEEMTDLAFIRGDEDGETFYDEVETRDGRDYLLKRVVPTIDLITAAYSVNYMGGLSAVFDGAKNALKPGGFLIFTTDQYDGSGYHYLRELQRFGHSEAYIRSQVERVGFKLHEIKPVEIYKDISSFAVVCQHAG